MNRCVVLLASLLSTHFALLGVDAMIVAYAEDAPPISSAKAAEVQHQTGTSAAEGSPNTGVGATAFGKNDSDSLGGAAVKQHGKANSDDNPAHVDGGGSNPGDHQNGSRGAGGEKETDSKDATLSGSHTGTDHNGTEFAPIDTRITIVGPRRSWRGSKAHDWKKFKVARTPGNLRYGLNSTRGTKSGVVRNAIGLAVEPKSPAIDAASKSTKLFANGETQAGMADVHRERLVPAHIGAAGPHDAPMSTAMNHSIVNGRDLVRPGSGSGAVGGAAKNVTGVIDGASFRPRRP